MLTRRELLGSSMFAGLAFSSSSEGAAQGRAPEVRRAPGGYIPVHTPNGWTLPNTVVDGVKIFHLVTEPIARHEFASGLVCSVWGFNGSSPGPTIEAIEGDRVRILVTNRLPEPTTVHWHGMEFVPPGMDGPAGLNQPAIPIGETFAYEFTLKRPGTFMYHSHFDEMVQIGMGMMGMFIVHPRHEREQVDRDFAIMLMEWAVPIGTARSNPFEMTEFNVFTMNGKVFPATEPMVVERGERVRIRFGNLSVRDHHPIHFHGVRFWLTATDGGRVPKSARCPETTVLVPVGTTRDIEMVPDNPGDWVVHCHMTHHFMNQMGHGFTNTLGARVADLDERIRKHIPGYMTMGENGLGEMGEMIERHMSVPRNSIPMLGMRGPFGFIDMGGMTTILKVRECVTEDPPYEGGWYAHPPGTIAHLATPEQLRGIDLDAPPRKPVSGPAEGPPPGASERPGDELHGGHSPFGAVE